MNDLMIDDPAVLLTAEDKEWLKRAVSRRHAPELQDKTAEELKAMVDEHIRFFSYINALPQRG